MSLCTCFTKKKKQTLMMLNKCVLPAIVSIHCIAGKWNLRNLSLKVGVHQERSVDRDLGRKWLLSREYSPYLRPGVWGHVATFLPSSLWAHAEEGPCSLFSLKRQEGQKVETSLSHLFPSWPTLFLSVMYRCIPHLLKNLTTCKPYGWRCL